MSSNDIFNNFPSDWYSIPLGQLVKESNGIIQTGPFGSQLHAEDYVLTGTPSIMPKNISVNGVIDTDIARIKASDLERLSRYQVKTGDIIYSRRGDVEKCALISERENGWLCGTGCILIRFGNSDISPEFLHAYLSHPLVRAWIVRHAIGATMPNLNTTILSELPVLVPSKKARNCIKENWTNLTKKILINSKINQTFEKMAQALFKSWFIDFEPVKAKISILKSGGSQEEVTLAAMTAISGKNIDELAILEREHPKQYAELKATAELFPSAMQESEQGNIPEGWKISAIQDVAKIVKGKSYKSTELDCSKTALVTLKSFNRGGGYRLDGLKEYTGKYKPEQEVFAGDLIIAYTDVTQAADVIGKPAMVISDTRYEHLVISLDVAVVRPFNDSLKYYLYGVARTEQFQRHTSAHSIGTTVLHLSKNAVPDYKFILANEDLVNIYSKYASSIFSKVNTTIEENNFLSELRDTLLPKLISGEITLPEVEEIAKEADYV